MMTTAVFLKNLNSASLFETANQQIIHTPVLVLTKHIIPQSCHVILHHTIS
jgi:hypothetical protein